MIALRIPLQGTHLVEASAGTGKTFTLVLLLLRAIITQRCQPRDLVAVTFTRAAAGELRERIRIALAAAARRAADPLAAIEPGLVPAIDELIKQAVSADDGSETRAVLARRLRAAELAVDEIWLATLHGYCQRLLSEFGPMLGIPGVDEAVDAGDDLMIQACADAWRTLQCDRDDVAGRIHAARFNTPEALLETLRPILAVPAASLVPPAPTREALETNWHTFHIAWTQAQEHAQRLTTLLEMVCDKQYGLSKAKDSGFCDKALGDIPVEVAHYFQQPPGSVSMSKSMRLLATQRLASLQHKSHREKGTPLPEHPLPDAMQALLDAEQSLHMALQVELMHRLHRQVRERMTQAGFEQGRARFDDLVSQVAAVLDGPAGDRLLEIARTRWRLALIDEFQDTDGEQYSVFRRLFAGRLILVGDPKQAIYRFRGGDVHAYRRASDEADAKHRLDFSHRSEPSLVDAVNQLFDARRIQHPFRETFIEYHPLQSAYDASRHGELRQADGSAGSGLWLWPLAGEKAGVWSSKDLASQALTMAIGQAAVELLDPQRGPQRVWPDASRRQPLRPGDLAVLCTANRQCEAVAAELRRCGVSVSLAADRDTESAAAEDIRRLLAAWLVPGDIGRLRALALSGLYGLDLARLDGDSHDSPLSPMQLAAHAEQVRLASRGEIARALLLAVRAGAAVAGDTDAGRARIDAWLRLLDRISGWAGPGVGLNDLYLHFRRWQAGLLREEAVARPAVEADAVQVMTIHASKGLEFAVVFAPWLWDQRAAQKLAPAGARPPVRFHDDHGDLRVDLGGPDWPQHCQRNRDEELAESMRLAYVAATRARHRLYLPVLISSAWPDSPLAHLLPSLDKTSAPQLDAELQQFAATAPTAIRVESPTQGEQRWLPPASDADAQRSPAARVLTRPIPDEFRLLSYSRLARGLVDLPQDHEQDQALAPDLIEAAPVAQSWLPRGAAFGSCFHALMERLDPHAPDLDELARIAADHGYGGERERMYLQQLWRDTISTSLPGEVRLDQLPQTDRVIELEFFLPLQQFDARHLGQTLADWPRYRRPPERWPATLVAARGYLRGFIDLIYRANGRYYVLDYKSNDLGSDADDYTADALAAAITDHDYDLQYLIYLVALQRLLRSRLGSDYCYERDIGGAVYLFVRGLGEGAGLFQDHPPEALVTALEAVFCGAPA